ncbi:MAG TPA: hypothetical protein VN685_11800 [Rhizomicrobium sp.]|nr:hypothetical protein [Rhizomicrobium sp.]
MKRIHLFLMAAGLFLAGPAHADISIGCGGYNVAANDFGYSKFRPLDSVTDTASVGGSLARGLGSLGILGSLLDFYAMTTDPDVCIPDES